MRRRTLAPRPLGGLMMVMGLATVAVLAAITFATLWLLRLTPRARRS